ncbi:unnamed protein product [Mytilus coruscus]|uniref:Uncharacterized protein n=1 Tax=Mytilus coruscus TaxID=42192 RepID=A0A6J8A1M0_MYTCO|nr:unnamed protein product [Mytilus coruscus]
MRDGAKELLHLKANALQGPHGVPASKTIYSVCMLREMLLLLADAINRFNHNYIESLNVNSLLTLVNEQLHSMLRLRVETPSVLDCARFYESGNITSTDDIIIIHHVGVVLAFTIDDVFCFDKVVESVKDASETCTVLLYKERDQPLEFHCEPSPSSVPCAFISESLNISGQDIGAVYIMDDEKFNELNIHRHTEHVSVE